MGRKRALAAGVGSIMDLSGRGTARALRSSTRRERSGVGGDWHAVGQEIRDAAKRVKSEGSAPRRTKEA